MATKKAAGKRSGANAVEAAQASIEHAALDELRAKAGSLDEARKALDQGAALGRGLWISFVSLGAYLFVAVGSVTHRDLFLETPLRLPLIGVDLPLVAFFWVTPLLFLILHANLLLNLKLVADNVVLWRDMTDAALEREADEAKRTDMRDRLRLQLPNFLLVQALAAPDMNRHGVVGFLIRLMLVATAAGGPAILLFLFQTQFLPYHRESVTWLHRIALIADMGMVWYFWRNVFGPARRVHFVRGFGYATSALLLFVSLVLATFPNERIHENGIAAELDRWVPRLGIGCPEGEPRWRFPTPNEEIPKEPAYGVPANCHYTLTQILFDAGANEVAGRSISLFSNRLILPDADFVTMKESDLKEAEVSISLRGRHLEKAVLVRADLRKADFTGAVLTGAKLDRAKLQEAKFECGIAKTARESKNSKLAAIMGFSATRSCADLRNAKLDKAELQGALLNGAQLQGASLQNARLQGASLDFAELQGAALNGAALQGASLVSADLKGALFQFPVFNVLQPVSLQLQGAALERANLKGASLEYVCLDGASVEGAEFDASQIYGVSLFATSGEPDFGEAAILTSLQFDLDNPVSRTCLELENHVPVTLDRLADRVKFWIASIPEGSARQAATKRLESLSTSLDPTAQVHWKGAAAKPHNPQLFSIMYTRTLGKVICEMTELHPVAKAMLEPRTFSTPTFANLTGINPFFLSSIVPADRLSLLENLLAAEGGCPGANHLNSETRARIAKHIEELKTDIAEAAGPAPKN